MNEYIQSGTSVRASPTSVLTCGALRHKTDPEGFDDPRCRFLAVHFGDQCRRSAVRPFCADRTIKLSFAVARGAYTRFRPAALRKPHFTRARVYCRNNGSNFRVSVAAPPRSRPACSDTPAASASLAAEHRSNYTMWSINKMLSYRRETAPQGALVLGKSGRL